MDFEPQQKKLDQQMLSPSWHAENSLICAIGVWKELLEAKNQKQRTDNSDIDTYSDDSFFKTFLKPVLTIEKLDSNAAIQDVLETSIDPNDFESVSYLIKKLVTVIASNVVQSHRDEKNSDFASAWFHTTKAAYWSGVLVITWSNLQVPDNPASALAKRRHKENYQMKEFAAQYWKENIDPNLSAQQAASIMDRDRVVNLSHKLLATVISQERKKLKK